MRVKALFLALLMFFYTTFTVDTITVTGVINGGLAYYGQSGTSGAGYAHVSPASISTDACAAINAAGLTLPATGGLIDAWDLGTATYTCTTQVTAQNQANKPVTVILNPGTKFTFNTSFATPTDTPASCAWQVGNGSALIAPGYNSIYGNFLVGSSAKVWDVLCDGDFTGNQESLRVDGIVVQGNSAATVSGSLIHLAGVFTPTRISNSGTILCYAQCLELDAGTTGSGGPAIGDLVLDGDTFTDGAPSGTYPGSVVNINALASTGSAGNINFYGGMIQGNGPHNPLLTVNGQGGVQTSSIGFFGTTFQTSPATTSSYWTNVDPVQLTDVSSVYFSNLRVAGATNTGAQPNFMDISQTVAGETYGINVNQMVTYTGNYTCLINNTVEGTCETGYSNALGDVALPNYTFSQVFPQIRQSSYLPTYTCANGSIHTYSGGTTSGNNNLYICSQGTWVAVK